MPPKLSLVILLPPRGSSEEAAAEDAARAAASLQSRPSALTLRELKAEGRRMGEVGRRDPAPNDVAVRALSSRHIQCAQRLQVIMFTSGTTGKPKGVILPHAAVIAAVAGLTAWRNAHAPYIGPDDVCAAYLPASHIFEFVAEQVMLALGGRLAFSHHSRLAARGAQMGDLTCAKCTVLPCVPAILERMAAGVRRAAPPLALRALVALSEAAWQPAGAGALGRSAHRAAALLSPAVLSLAFGAARRRAGRIRLVLCGGAPLSPELAALLRAVLGCPVVLGYGLTETACAGSLGRPCEAALGQSGPPIASARLKLVPWPEGGYSPAAQPPRGELHIGGAAVASGYLKRSSDDFYADKAGVRWVRTGDVGEVTAAADGARVVRIIDRKKDLIKLASGEYLSPAKARRGAARRGALYCSLSRLSRKRPKGGAGLPGLRGAGQERDAGCFARRAAAHRAGGGGRAAAARHAARQRRG